ncbi:MAG: M48 family metalloprotease [Actinomycetota bacterium]
MDFQSHQDQARQGTTRLIILLVMGITAIVAIVTAILTGVMLYASGEVLPLQAFSVAAPVTTIGIVGTSLLKSNQIKGGGGSYVAASMGGRPVDFNTLDASEKQLANVVEEIAIASGMPVPAVYVLDEEPGINAFAAGWSADNAAIGVTRGALQQLNRRELQGVIAHEFAHIANGDTRVKTRIIGWVYGIAIITVIGRLLLHHLWWAPRSRNNRDNNNAALVIMAAGVALLIVGWAGTLFAQMIQAAVSRQREYLADASAVQYTRDPSGIGEALMKIGGMGSGNKVRAAHAAETNHLFISSAMTSVFASHPPLKDRITRLLPQWNGEFPAPQQVAEAPSSGRRAPAGGRSGRPAGRPQATWGGALPAQVAIPGLPVDPMVIAAGGSSRTSSFTPPAPAQPQATSARPPVNGARQYGPPTFDGPTQDHIEHAQNLLARIPEPTQNFLHTRQGAVAAVVGALASDDPSIRPQQLALAAQATFLDVGYLDAAGRVITDLDRPLQLPAIDIALHSIRETPYDFKRSLVATIAAMGGAGDVDDLFRWILRRVMLRHLEAETDTGDRRHTVNLGGRLDDAITVYATLARYNSSGQGQADAAFGAALAQIGVAHTPLPAAQPDQFPRLDAALDRLGDLDRQARQDFVAGATAVVMHDNRATADEAELLRVVADAVGLPVPPLLPA